MLTAAHCIYDYFRTNGGYEIGSFCGEADNCDQKEEAFRIRTITLHPGYDDTISSDNDFALVRLKGTSTITPVQMDGDGVSLSDNYSAGKAVWAIGKWRASISVSVSGEWLMETVIFLVLTFCVLVN